LAGDADAKEAVLLLLLLLLLLRIMRWKPTRQNFLLRHPSEADLPGTHLAVCLDSLTPCCYILDVLDPVVTSETLDDG
jgi:hypothetical protein